MIGVYFSGTGNTKYCVQTFLNRFDMKSRLYSITDKESINAIKQADTIVLGYPVYFSDIPKIVKDFIIHNKDLWDRKRILVITTMGLFSGDGSGCGARLLKQYGATIIGGMHLKMPNNISDGKSLKNSVDKNKEIVMQTQKKITTVTNQIQVNKYPKEGLSFFNHIAGLLGQRLWFGNKTKTYSKELKINLDKCNGCRICVTMCPMENITIENNQAVPINRCTMCYRCINKCPTQAITLLGKNVIDQGTIEKYL